jgi:hypothetical protein
LKQTRNSHMWKLLNVCRMRVLMSKLTAWGHALSQDVG